MMDAIEQGALVTTREPVESWHAKYSLRSLFTPEMVGIVAHSAGVVEYCGDKRTVLGHAYVVDYPELTYNGGKYVVTLWRVNLTSDQIVRAKVSPAE